MHKRIEYPWALCAVVFLTGCHSFVDDIDLTAFQQAPAFDAFDLSHLKTAEPYTFVLLAENISSPTTLAQHGTLCAEATIPANCTSGFNSLVVTEGFSHCPDHDCAKFFMVNRVDENFSVGTRPELLAFFGAIDSAEEALVIVSAEGYSWTSTNIEEGAMRSVDDGFEILAWRYTSTCNPVEKWRYLLHVAPDGSVKELKKELIKSEDGCI